MIFTFLENENENGQKGQKCSPEINSVTHPSPENDFIFLKIYLYIIRIICIFMNWVMNWVMGDEKMIKTFKQ